MKLFRSMGAGLLLLTLGFRPALAESAHDFTLEQVLSAPFP